MTKQSLANKKHRLKMKKLTKEPIHNKLIFRSEGGICVYCKKEFTTSLKGEGMENSDTDWLKFYQERPFLGVIVDDIEKWHGLCMWTNYFKQGFDKL